MMRVDMRFSRADMRRGFFDRPDVQAEIRRNNLDWMSTFGAVVMRIARRSMRRTKVKRSLPGEPPRAHSGLLRDFTRFSYRGGTNPEVIIGPELLPGRPRRPTIPEVLEYGGTTYLAPRTITIRPRKGGRFTRTLPGGFYRIAARPYMRPAFEKGLAWLTARGWFARAA